MQRFESFLGEDGVITRYVHEEDGSVLIQTNDLYEFTLNWRLEAGAPEVRGVSFSEKDRYGIRLVEKDSGDPIGAEAFKWR